MHVPRQATARGPRQLGTEYLPTTSLSYHHSVPCPVLRLQASVVVELVSGLLAAAPGLLPTDIGVMAPFRKQARRLECFPISLRKTNSSFGTRLSNVSSSWRPCASWRAGLWRPRAPCSVHLAGPSLICMH